MEKGPNGAVFDVPSNFLSDRYRGIGDEIQNRFGQSGQRIPVRNIAIPNLRVPESLGRDEQFTLHIPRHRQIAGHLINIFMGKSSPMITDKWVHLSRLSLF